MEAIYKLKASELDISIIKAIKSLFKGKEVTIIVSADVDETSYLTADDVNEKHLLDNMFSDKEILYKGDEFKSFVDEITNTGK